MFESLEDINLYLWIPIILVFILSIIIASKKYYSIIKWFSFKDKRKRNKMDIEELYKTIESAGYAYDPYQDIFYSTLDAWQREKGYCRLYDEAAAPLSMIIDCEPIYFEYDGKRWMIEFWKGQYGMTTGCEIGVYTTDGPDLNIPGVFNGTFYHCASDEDLLEMSCSLEKNGKVLFTRKDKHWWLTGFILGEFSDPSELTVYLDITLKDEDMRNAFVEGLKKAGYDEKEIIIKRNSVSLEFHKALTEQPLTRIAETDWLTQKKNKLLCDQYQDITKGYDDFPDKVMAIQEQAPEIYEKVINLGKGTPLFKGFEVIKDYLNK